MIEYVTYTSLYKLCARIQCCDWKQGWIRPMLIKTISALMWSYAYPGKPLIQEVSCHEYVGIHLRNAEVDILHMKVRVWSAMYVNWINDLGIALRMSSDTGFTAYKAHKKKLALGTIYEDCRWWQWSSVIDNIKQNENNITPNIWKGNARMKTQGNTSPHHMAGERRIGPMQQAKSKRF